MSMLEKDMRAKKISDAELARRAREEKHEQLKAMIADHKLEFTYVRNHDEDGNPDQYGGAVLCWKMPARPTDQVISVSIAWCHELEKFDKVLGRFEAASEYLQGHHAKFKLAPGHDSISSKLCEVFETGFCL